MDETFRRRMETVLAAYGADPERWPQADRDALAPFLDEFPAEAAEAREIDAVLAAATRPEPQADAVDRLTAAARHIQPRRRLEFPLGAALPLAASLALGVYLGAMGTLDRFLPDALTGEAAESAEENADLLGIEEAETYADEVIS